MITLLFAQKPLTLRRSQPACLFPREVSVYVRPERGAAESHGRSHVAWEVWHWIHQHGGEDDARQQRPFQVRVAYGGAGAEPTLRASRGPASN